MQQEVINRQRLACAVQQLLPDLPRQSAAAEERMLMAEYVKGYQLVSPLLSVCLTALPTCHLQIEKHMVMSSLLLPPSRCAIGVVMHQGLHEFAPDKLLNKALVTAVLYMPGFTHSRYGLCCCELILDAAAGASVLQWVRPAAHGALHSSALQKMRAIKRAKTRDKREQAHREALRTMQSVETTGGPRHAAGRVPGAFAGDGLSKAQQKVELLSS